MEEAGLWRNLVAEELAVARSEVEDGGHPFATPIDEHVLFFADGPALADGGADEFLTELQPAVADLGVEYTLTPARDGDAIRIDDEVVDVTTGPDVGETATVAPLAALNRRLAEAGAEERFHTLNAGAQDGMVLLISPEVVDVLQDAGFDAPDETPVLADEG